MTPPDFHPDPTSSGLGVRGPTDGAMLSPYPPERHITRGEAEAWRAIERAEGLIRRAKSDLALAMSADNRADTALQDAWGWVVAMLDVELPAAKRALDEEE